MNMRDELLAGYSREHTMRVANFATGSPKRFADLVACFTSKEVVLAQRAAWALTWAARKKPERVAPHLETLVDTISSTTVHIAVTRCALSILEWVQLPEALEGRVMDACFRFIEQPGMPPACKAYSLTIIWNLAQRYPEIIPELKLVIESRWPYESPAFRSRARKILKAIDNKTPGARPQ